MLIGLTYDLRAEYLAAGYSEDETAEFDRADTIDALESALKALGHETDRIGNARQLVGRLAAGHRWDLVFNIAEGMYGLGREAQVPAILDVYRIAYTFSDPLVMSLCLHKGLTKLVVRNAGVPTPDFVVVGRLEDVDRILVGQRVLPVSKREVLAGQGVAPVSREDGYLPLPLFAKPVAEGTGKGVCPASKITDWQLLQPVCRDLLARYHQPVLVETFLPGREFTVGIVGTGTEATVLGTLEIVLRAGAEEDVYSYVNKERCEELVEYRIVSAEKDAEVRQAELFSLAAWQALGCRDAGRVDLRSDRHGVPQLLEVNPLAGLHPEHSDLPMLATAVGMPYVELIERIIRSAADRVVDRRATLWPAESA